MKNVLKPLAKSVLVQLGLTATASATEVAILKKMFGSDTATLITLNEEMNYIMKIIKYLEESSLLIKGVSETIKSEAKEQKSGFLSTLLGTLGASLFGNLLAGKGVKTKIPGKGVITACKGTIRTGEDTIRAG